MVAYLDHFWLQLDGLLPAVVPEVIASPEPVLRPLRDVGVEPWRDTHHVRLALQDRLPRFVAGCVLILRTVGPGVPGKGSVDLVGGEVVSLQTGPGWHEEASSRCFDRCPIIYTIRPFKC